MQIPSVISRKAAIAEAVSYVADTKRANVVPKCLFLHNGLGCFSVFVNGSDSDDDADKSEERIILFPLISSVGTPSEDFSEYPQMERVYLQDRLDLIQFIDRSVGGADACISLLEEDSFKTYYITVPSKGISAIVPMTLVQKSAAVRLLVNAFPSELPNLFKDVFETIGKGVIAANKSK